MGIFKLGSTLAGQASKVEAQTGTVAIMDHAISGTGASVAIVNNGNTRVNVSAVYLDTDTPTGYQGGATEGPGATCYNSTGGTGGTLVYCLLDPGERATFTNSSVRCTAGDPYTLYVNVTYEDLDTGVTHSMLRKFTGTC